MPIVKKTFRSAAPKSALFFIGVSLFAGGLLGTLSGCAAFSKRNQSTASEPNSDSTENANATETPESVDPQQAQIREMRSVITALSTRLDAIDSKMGTLNDKVDGTKANLEVFMSRGKSTRKQGVEAHPADDLGVTPEVTAAPGDPETGFATDDAILGFRKATILFQAGKFSEAVLAFSSFVERYPDHPLAGSAQYYVGSAYLKQKEYKLALQEFERVLTSYDRSPKIADTLRDMSETETALQKPREAARHRQMLLSIFPQSPAASGPAPEVQHTTSTRAHSERTPDNALAAPGAAAPAENPDISELPTAPLSGEKAIE